MSAEAMPQASTAEQANGAGECWAGAGRFTSTLMTLSQRVMQHHLMFAAAKYSSTAVRQYSNPPLVLPKLSICLPGFRPSGAVPHWEDALIIITRR